MAIRVETIENVSELSPDDSRKDLAALQAEVEQTYEEAREDVYYYLLRLGLTPAEAQEAAQEVFLRLYVTLRKGEPIENRRAWIFRVAHNHGLKLRSQAGRVQPMEPAVEAVTPHPGRTPDEIYAERDRWRRLKEAYETLSRQQKLVMHLRAEGLSFRDIADTLGISISTANEFLRRGVERLKRVVHE